MICQYYVIEMECCPSGPWKYPRGKDFFYWATCVVGDVLDKLSGSGMTDKEMQAKLNVREDCVQMHSLLWGIEEGSELEVKKC